MNRRITHRLITRGLCLLLPALLIACSGKEEPAIESNIANPTQAATSGTVITSTSPATAVENSGSDCQLPALADYADLHTVIAVLPDPFLSVDGKHITQKSDWRCRRAETGAQAQRYELGEKPDAPTKVSGSLNKNTLTVTAEENGKAISFDLVITLPDTGTPPYPAMIGMGAVSLNKTELLNMGVALIDFPNNELAEQLNTQSRGKGKFYDLYGSDHSAGALMAWSWGVSRLIDALETTDTPINALKLGVTGCSRNGKGAIIAGAFDERIALTIGQESGSGGAASWRVSEAQFAAGQNVQTLRQIVTENVWFTENFKLFGESANLLPFDHHQVMGMIAPRGLLIIDNSITWLGIESSYTAAIVAQEIWKAHGVADHFGVSQLLEHPHCQQPESQQPAINAFVQKFLFDNMEADTRVIKTEADIAVDRDRWVNWSTPDLQ